LLVEEHFCARFLPDAVDLCLMSFRPELIQRYRDKRAMEASGTQEQESMKKTSFSMLVDPNAQIDCQYSLKLGFHSGQTPAP
jgi:hypothetical protein